MRLSALVLAAAGLATLPALAQSPAWYAGIAAGQSRTDSGIVRSREDTLLFVDSVRSDFDATGDAWKVFAGFRFTPYIALEAGYADLGRSRMSSVVVGGTPSAPGFFSIDRRVDAFGADVVGTLPVGPRFALFARAGAWRAHVRSDVSLAGNIAFADGAPETSRRIADDRTVAHFGAGGEWRFMPRAALRLEWEGFAKTGSAFAAGESRHTGRADLDAVTLGALFDF